MALPAELPSHIKSSAEIGPRGLPGPLESGGGEAGLQTDPRSGATWYEDAEGNIVIVDTGGADPSTIPAGTVIGNVGDYYEPGTPGVPDAGAGIGAVAGPEAAEAPEIAEKAPAAEAPKVSVPDSAKDLVEAFADQYGMSPRAAEDTIRRFQRNRYSGEFSGLTPDAYGALAATAEAARNMPAAQQAIAELAENQGMSTKAAAETVLRYIVDPGAGEFEVLSPEAKRDLDVVAGVATPNALSAISYRAAVDAVERLNDTIAPYLNDEDTIDSLKAARAIRLGDKELRRALIKVGIKAEDIDRLVRFDASHITIGDSSIPISEWNQLDPKYQVIAVQKGIAAMTAAMRSDYDAYKRSVANMEKFKGQVTVFPGGAPFEYYEGSGSPVSAKAEYSYLQDTYDLVAAIKAGYIKDVRRLFPPETVKLAQDFIKAEEKAAVQTVADYAGERWLYRSKDGSKIITEAERQQILEKTPRAADAMVRYQPALILPVDPNWQELKDRPKDDPERQAYVKQWQKKAIDFASYVAFAATPWTTAGIGSLGLKVIPTILLKVPVLGKVPQLAAQLVVGVGKLTAAGAPPAILAAHTVDALEADHLRGKWSEFQSLSASKKNDIARQAGYEDYTGLTDAQKAVVLLNYAAPPGKTLDKWLEGIGAGIDDLTALAEKGARSLDKSLPAVVAKPVQVAEGVILGVVEGAGYAAALPLLAANIVDKAPEGSAKEFASQVATGMAAFFTGLPDVIKADPALQAGRMVGLFILSPKALMKLGKGLGYNLSPATIKGFGRAIAIEFTTLRVFPPKGMKVAKADMLQLGKSLVKQLASGKKKATAEVNGLFKAEIRNVPMQQAAPGRYYHFTTDISAFPKGQPVKASGKGLYFSPQAAKRFGLMSASGKAAKNTGLVELVVSEKYNPELHKLLGKGEVEIETVLRNQTLDYVGTGTGYDIRFGTYPIRQYILRGDLMPSSPNIKLSVGQKAKLQALVAKEAALDMVAGWYGRLEQIKRKLAGNPQVKRLDEQINKLEAEKPELTDNVKAQRASIPHPEGRGELKTRTKLITFNEKGDAVLIALDRSAPSFEFIGGSANPKEILLQSGKWHNFNQSGRKLTWAEAARSQLIGETTVKMPNPEYIGMYLGKVNDNALSGARIYRGKGVGEADLVKAWNLYQRGKFNYKTPELKAAVWLYKDGTIKGITPESVNLFRQQGVNPATYDILKYLKAKDGFNLKQVSVDKSNPSLLKNRDMAFSKRVASGRQLTTKEIAGINQKELKYLKNKRAEIIRGREPQLADWVTGEPQMAELLEFIAGRRRAVKVTRNRITQDGLKALEEHPDLLTKEAALIVEKQKKGGFLSAEEAKRYQAEINRAFEKQRRQLQTQFDKVEEAARRYYPHEYSRAYAYYMKGVAAALARPRAGRVDDERLQAVLEEAGRSPVAERLEPFKITEIPSRYISKDTDGTQRATIAGRESKAGGAYDVALEENSRANPAETRGDLTVTPTPYPEIDRPPEPPRVGTPRYSVPAEPPDDDKGKLKSPPTVKRGDNKHDFKYAETWKSGFGWWSLWPDGYSRFTREKPAGAKVVSGPQTPSRTVQTHVGKPPGDPQKLDLGIMDITLNQPPKTPNTKKGAIEFTLDRGQKTTSGIVLGRPGRRKTGGSGMKNSLRSKKVGRQYVTKTPNGNLVSRRRLGGII